MMSYLYLYIFISFGLVALLSSLPSYVYSLLRQILNSDYFTVLLMATHQFLLDLLNPKTLQLNSSHHIDWKANLASPDMQPPPPPRFLYFCVTDAKGQEVPVSVHFAAKPGAQTGSGMTSAFSYDLLS